jgi:hypothetical protein
MKNTAIALLAVCAASAHPARAAEVGFYVGGYVGQAAKDVSSVPYAELMAVIHELSLFTPADEQVSFDDTDLAYALIGGYRLNRYLALETSYARLGKVTYESRATGAFVLENGSLNTTLESDTSGFTLAMLGTLPLTRDWELFARAGALFATNKFRFSLTAQGQEFIPPPGNSAADSFSQSTTDYYAGIGISRRIFEVYDLRLEYQRVFDQGKEITGGQGDLNVASVGLTVTF